MRFIEIQQIRSATRQHRKQRATLIGLGLNKIGRIRWALDTPSSRGMIEKVSHLVKVNHDPTAPKPPREAPVYDEAASAALMRKLAFDRKNIKLEPYSAAEQRKGKTPDFKLYKDGKLRGYCEMKSPRDDFVFEKPVPGEAAVRKNLPFHRKIGSHIRGRAICRRESGSQRPEHRGLRDACARDQKARSSRNGSGAAGARIR
jgi:large subunit ribosomal protein L30